ncbi:MAG TPA: hypothetical protein VFX61_13060 [Micromonosporaceae bacterium]|nr:hypothetical protein [Micromonosporaceae bacterium]
MTTGIRTRITSALRRWSRRKTHRNTAAQRWQNLHAELTGKSHPNTRRTGRHRAGPPRHRQPHWWNAPTLPYPQVGRAGWLTPAQNWRANGGQRA